MSIPVRVDVPSSFKNYDQLDWELALYVARNVENDIGYKESSLNDAFDSKDRLLYEIFPNLSEEANKVYDRLRDITYKGVENVIENGKNEKNYKESLINKRTFKESLMFVLLSDPKVDVFEYAVDELAKISAKEGLVLAKTLSLIMDNGDVKNRGSFESFIAVNKYTKLRYLGTNALKEFECVLNRYVATVVDNMDWDKTLPAYIQDELLLTPYARHALTRLMKISYTNIARVTREKSEFYGDSLAIAMAHYLNIRPDVKNGNVEGRGSILLDGLKGLLDVSRESPNPSHVETAALAMTVGDIESLSSQKNFFDKVWEKIKLDGSAEEAKTYTCHYCKHERRVDEILKVECKANDEDRFIFICKDDTFCDLDRMIDESKNGGNDYLFGNEDRGNPKPDKDDDRFGWE